MIKVTRFNAGEVVINSELIESVEETPDTIITLVTGKKILIRETAAEVVARVIAYRRECVPVPAAIAALRAVLTPEAQREA